MTVIAPSLPSTLFTVPYLTVADYKVAPTGVDLSSLLPGATAAQRDAALAQLIVRASGLVNFAAQQNLAATTDTEVGRVTMNRAGEITVQTHCWPIVEVQSFKLGADPSSMTAVTLTGFCFIEHSAFTITQPSLSLVTNQGPLQFQSIAPNMRAFGQWVYVNGWPVTTLKTAGTIGQTSIVVQDSTGVHVGTLLVIYDAENTETVTVTAEPLGSQTVACTALTKAHATVGVTVSSIPAVVREAAIQMTSGLIKLKGNQAMAMRSISSTEPEPKAKSVSGTADITQAAWMLQPFKAVR